MQEHVVLDKFVSVVDTIEHGIVDRGIGTVGIICLSTEEEVSILTTPVVTVSNSHNERLRWIQVLRE